MSVSQIQYKFKTYYEDENCRISLEELEGQVFAHVTFHKFSRSILLTALKVWAEIKAKCYWLGYEAIYTYTNDERMQHMFPGSKNRGKFNFNDKEFQVLEWELN